MQRTLEPELMLEENQSQAYALADFATPNLNFVNIFQKKLGKDFTGNIVDLGCGNADITLRFARVYPNCLIDGIDGSQSMLNHGHKALKKEPINIQTRVNLIKGIIPETTLPQPHYDAIISNSLLHHLHNPSLLWQFIKTYGIGRTKVFVGDLLRPASLAKARATVELYAKNEPEILKQDFYNSLLAAFEIAEIESQLKLADLDCLEVEQISDRHVLISGSLPYFIK